ncbi:hypothetical protein SJI19_04520 [Acerihabitans sp. TG2]|uniref:hypothetical protein n=1 Tax=Acerihabitans sp. TG2 TaxID=3096008 RepID=UPI002B222D5F|nr:hypothetical protein [Acerihabitans sp. TG2]MEA9389822.1 hypothetical protein [Acerihabitans sp. TG2]
MKHCTALLILLTALCSAPIAQAAGCIKGAIVGGLAGHAVKHTLAGMAAGCAVGHHMAKKAAQNKTTTAKS